MNAQGSSLNSDWYIVAAWLKMRRYKKIRRIFFIFGRLYNYYKLNNFGNYSLRWPSSIQTFPIRYFYYFNVSSSFINNSLILLCFWNSTVILLRNQFIWCNLIIYRFELILCSMAEWMLINYHKSEIYVNQYLHMVLTKSW